jgi:citrate synthase
MLRRGSHKPIPACEHQSWKTQDEKKSTKGETVTQPEKKEAVRGLQDVIAAETRIGKVDGVNGKLYYAGYDVDDLAEKAWYEEVVFLLWNDRLPTIRELTEFKRELVQEMTLPKEVWEWFKLLPNQLHPMVVLRSAISVLALYDPEPNDNSAMATRRKATRLVAKIPTLIAAMNTSQKGRELLQPVPDASIAFNFLRMFHAKDPSDYNAKTMDLMLVLHADHGFNASTFSARVTASTLADIYGAITSAVATLQGPLHGGANQRVMEMLSDIGSPEDVDEYIDGLIAQGKRIMGFGHRVYQGEDPRTRYLRERANQVCKIDEGCHYTVLSQKIEEKTRKEKGIFPNVDFYSATVQHGLGIPVEYYTTIFAASRIAGWSAHVMEQLADNRLIRPKAQFTGKYPREFKPIDQR